MLEANEARISKRRLQITLLKEMVKSALVITLLNMSIVALHCNFQGVIIRDMCVCVLVFAR